MASDPHERPQGGQLLVAVSAAMVTIYREATGKGPDHCKTYWAGSDTLVILLSGGYTVAEQTLFEAGRGSLVQDSRRAIQQALADQMTEKVEDLTGRKVVAFMSASHQDPDLSAEILVFAP